MNRFRALAQTPRSRSPAAAVAPGGPTCRLVRQLAVPARPLSRVKVRRHLTERCFAPSPPPRSTADARLLLAWGGDGWRCGGPARNAVVTPASPLHFGGGSGLVGRCVCGDASARAARALLFAQERVSNIARYDRTRHLIISRQRRTPQAWSRC